MRFNATNFTTRGEVPKEMVRIARERTDFLFAVLRSHPDTTVRDMLASAYLQGMDDGVNVMLTKSAQS